MDKLLSDIENNRAKSFWLDHGCDNPDRIKILNNSIGYSVIIKCKNCNKKENITDYNLW